MLEVVHMCKRKAPWTQIAQASPNKRNLASALLVSNVRAAETGTAMRDWGPHEREVGSGSEPATSCAATTGFIPKP